MHVFDYHVTFVDVDVPTVTITVHVTVGDVLTEPSRELQAVRNARKVLSGRMFNIDQTRLTCTRVHEEEETS